MSPILSFNPRMAKVTMPYPLKKIDVLMIRMSQYNVLHHFTAKLYEAFVRAGCSTRLFEGDGIVKGPKDAPPDMTVGFNGAPRNAAHELFCDNYHIPHLSLLVDPPYRFLYLTSSPYTLIGCDDRVGCSLLQTVDFKRGFFLPHAVEPELAPLPDQERIFDVAMLATFIDHEQRRKKWRSLFPPALCKIMDIAIEITFSDSTTSFITAFNNVLLYQQKKHPKRTFEGVFLGNVLEELEMYVKGRDRAALIKSVPDSMVHIFGNNLDQLDWKSYLGTKHPNIYVHGSVSYPQALEIMKKTKIVLNPSLKNKDGAHERIFSGLACGALVVTNESRYLRETFKDNQGLYFYAPHHMEKIREDVNTYLLDEDKRYLEAKMGREIVMKHHTWDNRVAEIRKIAPSFLKEMKGASH